MNPLPPVKYDIYPLKGGMDQITPTMSLPPGVARRGVNFECTLTGGYSTIQGYERFDGHTRPSDATYIILECTITGTITVGNTVTGVTSGATAKVIYIDGSDVVVTRQTGSFTTEVLNVGGSPQATVTSTAGAAADGSVAATYLNLAADEYRASITEVPGSGDILGVCSFNSIVYAFRNNAGGTAAELYKSTSSGWTLVPFGEEISFTNGNANLTVGDVLTQGGVTSTVARIVVLTGTLISGTNTGRMILTGRAGGAYAAGAATSTGAGAVTLSGASTAITLVPGGKFRFAVGKFGAGYTAQSVYGADGKNRAFEFDGTNLVPITTGMSVDTPNLIAIHKSYLFLTFGTSLQFSSIGNPFVWSVVTGAGEVGMSDTITNLVALPGDQTSGALGVFTTNDTSVLYGTSSTNFSLTTFNSGSGALYDTGLNLESTYLLNNFGVTTLSTTRDFGNFNPAALTANLYPFISERISNVTVASINRRKSQYRLYFGDGSGLYLTIAKGQYIGGMPIEYPNPVLCVSEGRNVTGNSTIYFGSDNGFVYEMDAGTSFDGTPISTTLELVFNGTGNNRMLKRYRKASFELRADAYVSFDVGYALAFGSDLVPQGDRQTYSQFLRNVYWDAFTWDAFTWDGSGAVPAEIDLTGTAENISIRVTGMSDSAQPYTISAITMHYTPRRGLR